MIPPTRRESPTRSHPGTPLLVPLAALFAALLAIPPALGAQDTLRVGADDLGRWGDTLVARPEVRIGALTGDPAYTFGLITDLAVGRDGTIYVADVRVPAIHRYDPTGAHLGAIGREGEGPGEYRRPVGLEALSDGGLALWDYGNRRISVYGPDGEFRRSHRVPTGLISAHRMFYADTADHLYVRTALFTSGMPPDQGLIRLSPGGASSIPSCSRAGATTGPWHSPGRRSPGGVPTVRSWSARTTSTPSRSVGPTAGPSP